MPDPRNLNADPVYRAQTSMLQWLRGRGHAVDFGLKGPPELVIEPTQSVLRANVGLPCPYCRLIMTRHYRFPTRDHVRPRRAGGTLRADNCLIVCAPCNNDKADMMLGEFAAWLEEKRDARAPIVRLIVRERGAV